MDEEKPEVKKVVTRKKRTYRPRNTGFTMKIYRAGGEPDKVKVKNANS
jgi:hypothetical protein